MPLFDVISSIHKKKRKACSSCRPPDVKEVLNRFSEVYLEKYTFREICDIFGDDIPNLGKIIMAFYNAHWKVSEHNLLKMLKPPCQNNNTNCMNGRKDLELSNDFRNKGNEAFNQNSFITAQDFYTMSLLFAPKGSEALALAYGNRSAAYMHRGFFEHVVEDCDLALQAGHKRVGKLLYRKAEALIKMNKMNAAQQALDRIEATEVESDKELILLKMKEGIDLPLRYPYIIGPIRKEAPKLSSKLKIVQDPNKGTCTVATEKIDFGELILDESAYATTFVTFSFEHRYCHHCKRQIVADNPLRDSAYSHHINPHPCQECSNVLYCCDECRNESWKQYHRFECRYLDLIYFPSEHPHLALRALVTTNLLTIYEIVEKAKRKEHTLPKAGNWKTKFVDPQFENVFNLDLHWEDCSNDNRAGFFRQTFLLSVFLIESGYIDQKLEESFGYNWKKIVDRNEWIELVVGVLYRLIIQARTHTQPMKRLQETLINLKKSSIGKYEAALFASGLFPVHLPNLNHSCQSNTNLYVEQCNRVILRASKIIEPGEEVTFVYLDFHYSYAHVFKRRLQIKEMLYFDCRCDRCALELAFWRGLKLEELSIKKTVINYDGNLYFEAFHCDRDSKAEVEVKDSEIVFECSKCKDVIEPESLINILVNLMNVFSDNTKNNVVSKIEKLAQLLDETTCPVMATLLAYCSVQPERKMFESSVVSELMIDYIVRFIQTEIGVLGKFSTVVCMNTVLWFNLQWELELQKAQTSELERLKVFGQELMDILNALSVSTGDEVIDYWGYFWLLKLNVGERLQNA